MAYFNQLQGYMSNLQEGINHENDVKQEYGDKLATTIEDKFNNISQQAEGWGGALTAAGTVWKHGRKVYRTLQSQGQAATDGSTTTATNTGGGNLPSADDALQNLRAATDQLAQGITPSVRGATQVATTAGNLAPATVSAPAAGGGGAAGGTTAQNLAADQAANAGRINLTRAPTNFQSNTSSNLADAINGNRATGQAAAQTGGSAAGGAPPSAINPAPPVQNTGGVQNNIAQPPTNNPDPAGNAGGRAVTDADAVVNDTDTLTNTISNIGSKVMGGMDAALDGIPVIGEIIGIGSLIGGLIHGLDKKNEEAKASSATQQGGTVGGGIDTSVFKGNTLGSGGGGYTV